MVSDKAIVSGYAEQVRSTSMEAQPAFPSVWKAGYGPVSKTETRLPLRSAVPLSA